MPFQCSPWSLVGILVRMKQPKGIWKTRLCSGDKREDVTTTLGDNNDLSCRIKYSHFTSLNNRRWSNQDFLSCRLRWGTMADGNTARFNVGRTVKMRSKCIVQAWILHKQRVEKRRTYLSPKQVESLAKSSWRIRTKDQTQLKYGDWKPLLNAAEAGIWR